MIALSLSLSAAHGLFQQDYAGGHHHHAEYEADDGVMVFAVFFRCRQEFVKRYVDHDACRDAH